MKEWKEYQLGDVCSRLSSGKNISASKISDSDVYPVFGGNGLRGYTDNSNFTGECAIIGRQGAFCENVKFFSGEAYMTEHAVVVCGNEKANTRYLSYLLSTMNLGRLSGQSAQPGLAVGTLAKQLIKLPPLPTQQKIAAILSSLDDKIELNNKINTNLEQQAQALFKNFSEKSSKSVKFTDLIYILGGGTPKTNNEDYWNGKIPFFTPKDVGNPYCLLTEKKITESGLDNCNSRLYPVNTIFVTARGTVGKVCLAGLPMAMNQSCYALKSKDDNQLLAYFYTLEAINSLKHKANGATFDAIVTRDFETETINILSEQDTKEFTQIVKPIFEKILTNQKENINLSNLRDTLLPKLMNGDVIANSIIINKEVHNV